MYIITEEFYSEREVDLINTFLEYGVEGLHIRKPNTTLLEMRNFISKINPSYYPQIVLHQHHDLANEFGISRLHFSESNRQNQDISKWKEAFRLSTSTHTIEDFNQLTSYWDYAFISPVFESISKLGYEVNESKLNAIIQRTNHQVKMIALGGITLQNQHLPKQKGADDVAYLGAIWHSKNPIKTFLECKQKDHL